MERDLVWAFCRYSQRETCFYLRISEKTFTRGTASLAVLFLVTLMVKNARRLFFTSEQFDPCEQLILMEAVLEIHQCLQLRFSMPFIEVQTEFVLISVHNYFK